MNKDTINAIATLLTLFTEEQKEALKINLGSVTVTLEEQFVDRWYDCRPICTGKRFLYKAAYIINGNQLLFRKIIEFEKQEFQEKLVNQLMDPDSYAKVKSVKTDNLNDLKGISMSQSTSKTSNRIISKSRSGSSESGQEYFELDKVWEEEDNKYLEKGLAKQKFGVDVNIDQTKRGLDKISLNLSVIDPESVKDFENKASDFDLQSYEPTLQSISVNQSRNKTIGQTNNSVFGIRDQHRVSDGRSVTKNVATFEALQLLTASRIKDPRETAFQKLDVLFTRPCL